MAKHFCAQGETTGGVNASAARIGERELREIHFPSAKACCEAGVEGIMAAYNEIDGVYCHRNAWLLRDVLRGEMGFDGIVMADGLAVDFLKNTEGEGCEYTLEFGDMWEQFYTTLEGNFDKAMRFIFLNGLLANYYERIEKLIDSVSDCGWGFYDTLQDIYSEYR